MADQLYRIVTNLGYVFLNVGTRGQDPLQDLLVCQKFLEVGWVLQERIIWQKATEDGRGHFTPITSGVYLNNMWESIFVLTKDGRRPLDRLAVGVPYTDMSNTTRWQHGRTQRCRGDVWYIPYETINSRSSSRAGHPATFPRELVERCLRLVEHGRTGLNVLDPCCGTGTVLDVAAERGHCATGIDLNPRVLACKSTA